MSGSSADIECAAAASYSTLTSWLGQGHAYVPHPDHRHPAHDEQPPRLAQSDPTEKRAPAAHPPTTAPATEARASQQQLHAHLIGEDDVGERVSHERQPVRQPASDRGRREAAGERIEARFERIAERLSKGGPRRRDGGPALAPQRQRRRRGLLGGEAGWEVLAADERAQQLGLTLREA